MNMMMVAQRVLAARLFGLGEDECRIVLDVLVDTAYLRETAGGKVTLGYRVAA